MYEGPEKSFPKKTGKEHLRGLPKVGVRGIVSKVASPLLLKAINKHREKAAKALKEGQRFPDQSERALIDAVNEMLAGEFARLRRTSEGMGRYEPLQYEQVHVVSGTEALGEDFFSKTYGLHHSLTDVITLAEKTELESKLHFLTHEAVHSSAFVTHGVTPPWGSKERKKADMSSRSGYNIDDARQRGMLSASDGSFLSFNEAVVESITQRLLAQHAQKLAGIIPSIDLQKLLQAGENTYRTERKILDVFIEETAKRTGEDTSLIRERIEREHFGGHMMHIRTIERACGENSVLLLSLFNGYFSNKEEAPEQVRQFLATPVPRKRYRLARSILLIDDFADYVERADWRSIRAFLRRPLPTMKDGGFERDSRDTIERIYAKLQAVEVLMDGEVRKSDELFRAVRNDEAEVMSKVRAYEAVFGPIELPERPLLDF